MEASDTTTITFDPTKLAIRYLELLNDTPFYYLMFNLSFSDFLMEGNISRLSILWESENIHGIIFREKECLRGLVEI